MVTQPLSKESIRNEEFSATRTFLADFGISERNVDEYLEEDVAKAIHRRGWKYELRRADEPPGWRAEIRKRRPDGQIHTATAHDPDRRTALLRALERALTWLTPEEAWDVFDAHTREMLGMSGSDFLKRLDRGKLSLDDSRVVHLMVMRPSGT